MNRRSILTALAGMCGLARAQSNDPMTPIPQRPDPDWQQCKNPAAFPSDCERKPAKNGQCPVCSWQAPPYRRGDLLVKDRFAVDGICIIPGSSLTGPIYTTPCSVNDIPAERRIDCEQCNNTFRQRAEPEKSR